MHGSATSLGLVDPLGVLVRCANVFAVPVVKAGRAIKDLIFGWQARQSDLIQTPAGIDSGARRVGLATGRKTQHEGQEWLAGYTIMMKLGG